MPRNIAYDLGFKVVSALSALKHEGLTQQDVDRITAHVNVRIQAVLNTAELALQKLKRNWKQEARYLASGEGDMYQLSLEALALVDWVMAEVELCKQLS